MKKGLITISVVFLVIAASVFAINVKKVLLTSEGINGYKSVLEQYSEINTHPQPQPGSFGILGAFGAMARTPQQATDDELVAEIKNLTPYATTPLEIFERIIGIIADDFYALGARWQKAYPEFVDKFNELTDAQQEKIIAIMTKRGIGIATGLQEARTKKIEAEKTVE